MLMDGLTIVISAVALIVSILSYRQAFSVKAVDLRIEANKAREDVRQQLAALKQSHADALKARKALNAARGLLRSGAMQGYEQEWNQRGNRVTAIEAEFTEYAEPTTESKSASLEKLIAALHGLHRKIEALQSQYDADAGYNEREVAQLRADRRERQ